uniref:Uncharacterized protein n=1 Tax=Oryza glaberrima TaxID=4538 RepID=I1PAR8_ORYGL
MDCVGSGKEGGVSLEETVPLLEYVRLSQPAWLPDEMDPLKSDANGEPTADADGDAEAAGGGAEGTEASQGAPVPAAVAATKADSVEADRVRAMRHWKEGIGELTCGPKVIFDISCNFSLRLTQKLLF